LTCLLFEAEGSRMQGGEHLACVCCTSESGLPLFCLIDVCPVPCAICRVCSPVVRYCVRVTPPTVEANQALTSFEVVDRVFNHTREQLEVGGVGVGLGVGVGVLRRGCCEEGQ
jgi:hypothetical protein